MSVLLVSYDLHKPDKDYKPLLDALKRYRYWSHAQESVWFVDTSSKPDEVRDFLKQFIHENDQLFVVRLHKHWAANRSDRATKWLMGADRTWD